MTTDRASGSLRVFPPAELFEAATRVPTSLRLVLRQPATGGLLVAVFRGGRPAMVFSPDDGRSLADLLAAAGLVDRETLDRLAQARPQASGPLHRLVIDNTPLDVDSVQRFLDFQARQRLLDVLVWREGYFEIEEYGAAAENEFTLALPSIPSLVARAENRSAQLPGLLASLPDTPSNTLVRRRRAGAGAKNLLEDRVLRGLRQPQLLSGLVAQTLVDDDLLIEAVLSLASRDAVRLEPRARLVEAPVEPGNDLRTEALVRDILTAVRRGGSEDGPATLWLVVISDGFALASSLIDRLRQGDEPGRTADRTGVTSVTLHPSAATSVCLLALDSRSLTRGALEGVMGRCDGLVVLRGSDDPGEGERLDRACQELLAARYGEASRPAVLGLDDGARLRRWPQSLPDAVLGLPGAAALGGSALLTALLEGVLAAEHGRSSVEL